MHVKNAVHAGSRARFVAASVNVCVTGTPANEIVFAAVQDYQQQDSYAPAVSPCTFELRRQARTVRIFMRSEVIAAQPYSSCPIRNYGNKLRGF